MKITLFAKSSSRDEPYSVEFYNKKGLLSVFCDCPAGIHGQLCKHKRALASNNKLMLFDNSQLEDFNKVNEWVMATDYPKLIEEVVETEKEIEALKKKLKSAKAMLARVMRDGLK
jgi:uncharacterized Zn finger protein